MKVDNIIGIDFAAIRASVSGSRRRPCFIIMNHGTADFLKSQFVVRQKNNSGLDEVGRVYQTYYYDTLYDIPIAYSDKVLFGSLEIMYDE